MDERISRAAVVLAAATVLAGCSAGSDGAGGTTAPPPAPPAACMLDSASLSAATGLTWKADQVTASDTRCVYDPAPAAAAAGTPVAPTVPAGRDFVAVDVTRFTGDPVAELDTLAQVCEAGSRAPSPDGTGFVCRFAGGSVYAAATRNGRAITVSASAVPAGTTAARLVVALGQQLGSLR